jgi:Protein of unknown function (DUF3823) N-terminal domain/Domain of unknown function (DUF3823_C)
MKSAIALVSLAALVGVSGCGLDALDNYEQPSSRLNGNVVYNGAPVGVRSNGVQLELWQPDYELNQKIPVFVDQDGSFSAVLFDGTYRLNLLAGGPWVENRDTIQVEVNGTATVTFPVIPYYTVANETIVHANGSIVATFGVGQVTTSRALDFVGVYVATTSFVDRTNMAARLERARSGIANLNDPITLTVDLPANLAQRTDVFVRIGVKTVGIAEMLFSPVYRIAL